MKKRLISILLMCCMVLTLLPTTAFAEGGTEEPLVAAFPLRLDLHRAVVAVAHPTTQAELAGGHHPKFHKRGI